MVAAARMRKATAALFASRPYADLAWKMLVDLSAGTDRELHPLLKTRPVKTVLFVVITSDRGLCGAYNMNIIHQALKSVRRKEEDRFIALGKKGRDFLARRGFQVIAEFTGLPTPVSFLQVGPIAQLVSQEYASGRVDEVSLVYGKFVSNLVQKAVVLRLLPLAPSEKSRVPIAPFLYEPTAQAVISSLLPRIIEYEIYAALLESQASEFAARMMAMTSATDNAQRLITELTLVYNKARQETITKELAELSTSRIVIEEA
jgi:F-type H+-transporting ATPase subunit gamma